MSTKAKRSGVTIEAVASVDHAKAVSRVTLDAAAEIFSRPLYHDGRAIRTYDPSLQGAVTYRPKAVEQHRATEEVLGRMIRREPIRIVGGLLDGERTIRDHLPGYRVWSYRREVLMVPDMWVPGTEAVEIAKLRILGAKR